MRVDFEMNGYSRFPNDKYDECPSCERYAVPKETDLETFLCMACFTAIKE